MLLAGKRIFEQKAVSKKAKKVKRNAKPPASKEIVVIINKSPKIIIDNDFVANYLKEQNDSDANDLAQNMSVISLNDSTDSVEFVPENAASYEMKKIAQLNEKLSKITKRNRRLELHVKALQKRILNSDSENQQAAPIDDDVAKATAIDGRYRKCRCSRAS